MTPIELIKTYITQGLSPKFIIEKMGINNPIINNLMNMAQNGNVKGLENFARNMMQERGRDFDKEFYQFRNTFNNKF